MASHAPSDTESPTTPPTKSSSKLGMLLWLVPIGVFALMGTVIATDYYLMELPRDAQAEYVGKKSCLECHREQAEQWKGSDHDWAMAPPTEETVLGDFDNAEFEHYGITSKMFRRDGKYFVTTEGPEGEMETYEVKYTFGYQPLQQYLVELDGGRIQALAIAWDTEKEQWFLLDPEQQRIPHDDVLHWTNRAMNWNHMCADCHSTDVKKNFDLDTKTYHTSFHEINVSCEACHGPGSLHEEMANSTSLFWDRHHGYGLAKLKGKENALTQIETCAKCHSRRHHVYPHHHGGSAFLDHYTPELLDSRVYHPDGQLRPEEEGYVYGSFLQSKMFRKGVRCTDCHNPHTTKLHAQGNNLCVRCHTAGKYDTPTHHHHPVDSKGARCVECHMPETTYMHVDPRRDHSIRIPRPDLTLKIGTPNACNHCHTKQEEDAQWAADQVVSWYGPKTSNEEHFGEIIALAREGKAEALDGLIRLVHRKDGERAVGPLVRASAVTLLGQRYYHPMVENEVSEVLVESLQDEQPLVRFAAVRALEPSPRAPEAPIRIAKQIAPLVNDPLRAVRMEAARVLTAWPDFAIGKDLMEPFRAALNEFREGLKAQGDQAGAHLGLGMVAANLGKFSQAEEHYRTALDLDPQHQVARLQLAILYQREGENDKAEAVLREGVKQLPNGADAHYDLGLFLAENPERLAEAEEPLAAAVRLAPDVARFHYNYGILMNQLGKLPEAEKALRRAYELTKETPELAQQYLETLVLIYRDAGKWDAMYSQAVDLTKMAPQNPNYRELAGLAAFQLGEFSKAETALRSALSIRSQSPEALHLLAMICAQQGRWDEAETYALQAVQMNPRNPMYQQTYQHIRARGS